MQTVLILKSLSAINWKTEANFWLIWQKARYCWWQYSPQV